MDDKILIRIWIWAIISFFYLVYAYSDFTEEAEDLGIELDTFDYLFCYCMCLFWPIWLLEDLYHFIKNKL